MNKFVQLVFVLFYCIASAVNILLFSFTGHWFFLGLTVVSVLTAIQFAYLPTEGERKIYKN